MPIHIMKEANSESLTFPATHDFNPDWDYGFDELPPDDLMQLIQAVLDDISANVLPALGFEHVVVWFAPLESIGEDCLGRYISGTGATPFIALNIPTIQNACYQTGDTFSDQLNGTVVHELGHAYLATRCMEGDIDLDDEEMAVEDFSYVWVMTRKVDVETLNTLVPLDTGPTP